MKTITPIRKQITVNAAPARTFEVFTAGMHSWWDPEYSIGAEPMATVVVEGWDDGCWYEMGDGGAECDWGRVLVWDPPSRLGVDWQITAEWQHDPDLHTELEVRFSALGASATLVELEHRGLETLKEQAGSIHALFDGPGGWMGLLVRFGEALPA